MRLSNLYLIVLLIAAPAAYGQSTSFTLDLLATDGNAARSLTAGADEAASDDFDPSLDVLAPPPPPAGAFDVRIQGQNGGVPTGYYTDLRAPVGEGQQYAFRLLYAPSVGGSPVVLSWDPADLVAEWSYSFVDQLEDPDVVVDLRSGSSLDTGLYDATDDPDCAPFPDGDPSACVRSGVYLLVEVPGIPPVDLTASVSQTTVAPGGSIVFSYTVDNNTGNAQTGDLYFVARRGGAVVAQGVVISGTIQATSSISNGYTQNVPGNARPGEYLYTISVGRFSSMTAVDAQTFTITVTAAGRAVSAAGWEADWTVSDVGTWPDTEAGAASSSSLPAKNLLHAGYPNPFSSQTVLGFDVAEAQHVELVVYDVLGREVARLLDGRVEAGRHQAVLDGHRLPSGAYVARLVTENGTALARRLTLVR